MIASVFFKSDSKPFGKIPCMYYFKRVTLLSILLLNLWPLYTA